MGFKLQPSPHTSTFHQCRAQAELDPMYGAASRAGSQTAAASQIRSGGGMGAGGHGNPSNSSLLSSGPSQGRLPVAGQGAQQQQVGVHQQQRQQ